MGIEALLTSQIIGFAEGIDDRVNALLQAGSNITLTYNDGANTLTIAATGGSANCEIKVYTSSDTWSKPTNCKSVKAILVGAGGGGGSGRRGAASTTRGGGGGGGGGGLAIWEISADELSSSESVTVGAGGAGGAVVTVDDTNGNIGAAGGSTDFGNYRASGGGGGGAGIAGNAAGGTGASRQYTIGAVNIPSNQNGGTGSGDSLGTDPGNTNTVLSPRPGGGGGSISSTNTFVQGRNGGSFKLSTNGVQVTVVNGASRSTAEGANGGGSTARVSWCGSGAGGGYGGNTQAATRGGHGILGAGGGGGGGSTNGYDSGAGGNGGNGIAVIISFMGT